MLLNNDSYGRWVNGSIGQVIDIIHMDGAEAVRVRLSEGQEVDVTPFTWEVIVIFMIKKRTGLILRLWGHLLSIR